ncbi:MAG: DNA recombination protein RmuC [Candidatus Magasanikbacteria bacterium]|nr:DNA recombination protein RmuC [Candidatus Magasanikbacteria bacterium]
MTTTILLIILVALSIALLGALALLYRLHQNNQDTGKNDALERQLTNTTQTVLQQLNAVTKQVNDRLRESTQVQQQSQQTIGDRLDASARAYAAVTNKLSELQEANKRIYDVGKDISSLQEILRSPKLRGTIGELFLGNLLSQILPPDHYTEQHRFQSGEVVDAVVKLRDNMLVPVDSKFPLENFQKMLSAADDDKEALRKMFVSDVKKHIDKIAKQYILPDEGTLNMALMYIPAENVYYETIVKGIEENDLVHYAHAKNVIPVSPNSFYVYLQTILLGLRGMQIESSAREMMQNLSRLKGDLERFNGDYLLVGKHLTNASRAFDDSRKRLEKFDTKFEKVAQVELAETPAILIEE